MTADYKPLLLLCAALCSLSTSDATTNHWSAWTAFKTQFGRWYPSPDERRHFDAFKRTADFIERFNLDHSFTAGYTLGLNNMSDWTEGEQQQLLGLQFPNLTSESNSISDIAKLPWASPSNTPESFDWRDVEGAVTPVKNQGTCNACWAFAVTGALEAHLLRTSSWDRLVPLSEQNLIDCSKHNHACMGGWPHTAFMDIAEMGGIWSDHDYPYEGRKQQCLPLAVDQVMTVLSWLKLPESEEALKRTIANYGPVAVGIDSRAPTFWPYSRGVYNDFCCRNLTTAANHVMLAVGYGTDPQLGDYWILKNSWGPSWGEDGYMRLARNRDNLCGVASNCFVPTFQ